MDANKVDEDAPEAVAVSAVAEVEGDKPASIKEEAAAPEAASKPAEASVKTEEGTEAKRKRDDEAEPSASSEEKKAKTEEESSGTNIPLVTTLELNPEHEPDPIPASTEGTTVFHDADVLSGRGGGTNVHPGNRNFRDMINLHRRAYLKARKNDKPAISRAIVRTIRQNNGRFLKKDEKSGLWFEIGDDAAREKTSQALRQRAPEMRKLLFDTEREEARAAAEEHMRHHRMMMVPPGMTPEMMANMPMPPNMAGMPMGPNGVPMFPNPFFPMPQQGKGNGKNGGENGQPQMPPYPMFPFMGGPMPPFQLPHGANGAPAPNAQPQQTEAPSEQPSDTKEAN